MAIDPLTAKLLAQVAARAATDEESRRRTLILILAPILGLSDVIVDIVETGTTLRENGLRVVTEFMPISARFIANKASYQFKHREMDEMLEKLRAALAAKEEKK